MDLSLDVHIHPFRFLRVRECSVYKENDAIVTAKFALAVEDGMDDRQLKERLVNQRAEFSIDEEFLAPDLEAIYAALQSFDVMDAERALHVNGITDVLSIHQLKRMECFLPVLMKVYDDAREEIIGELSLFGALARLSVDDPLGSLDRLNRKGFFRSWDREVLRSVMRRQRVICRGMLGKLTLRTRAGGRVLTGVIDTALRLPVSGMGIPALEVAPSGWISLTHRWPPAVHTPPLFI